MIIHRHKPPFSLTAESVYVLCDGEHVKIGRTRRRVVDRVAALQTGCARKIKPIVSVQIPLAAVEVEHWCHRKLAGHRANGEWFLCSKKDAVAALVAASAPYLGRQWVIHDKASEDVLRNELQTWQAAAASR